MKVVIPQPAISFRPPGLDLPLRSLRERIQQTIAFEAGGLIIAAPLYATVFGASLDESAMLLAALSVACLMWCPLHNAAFDWLEARHADRSASDRPHRWRAVHAISHELSVLVVTLPLIMSLGGLNFIETLSVEFGLTLFYTGYAYLFHFAFDKLRPVRTVP